MHHYLQGAYWSQGLPLEVGARCRARASAPTRARAQVLARFISDFATFCYVCDVYVLEGHRGRGVARAMLALALEHPRLQGLRRWHLVTRDAHALYRACGFAPLAQPERHMERARPDFYKER